MAPQIRQKTAILDILKRAAFPPETIAGLDEELPDEVDLDKYGPLLSRYGVTRNELMSRMGGSP